MAELKSQLDPGDVEFLLKKKDDIKNCSWLLKMELDKGTNASPAVLKRIMGFVDHHSKQINECLTKQ